MSYEAELLREAINGFRECRGTDREAAAELVLHTVVEVIKDRQARRGARKDGGR